MHLDKLALPSLLALASLASAGCNEPKKTAAASAKPTTEAMPTPPPKPKGPPQFVVDSIGAKVGFSRILLDKPGGPGELAKELGENKRYIDGKNVDLNADRKSKTTSVIMMLSALAKDGAKSVTIKTGTREEYPDKVKFTPESLIKDPARCSVVTMVLEDRTSAVWRLSGTTALRHSKGLAGPDLSATGDTIERLARGCPKSSAVFVSVAKGIKWGLAYDLAASTQKLKKVTLDTVVLLKQAPVAGRKVKL